VHSVLRGVRVVEAEIDYCSSIDDSEQRSMFCCLHRCISYETWRSLDVDSESDSLCFTIVADP